MSKQFIADVIRDMTGATVKLSNETADVLMDQIVKTLKKEGVFQIFGFGKFEVKRTKARMGRNPYSGETIKIKAHKVVRFKASKTLRDSV